MPFLTTTNDVYVGARTDNLSLESSTRNLYTTAALVKTYCKKIGSIVRKKFLGGAPLPARLYCTRTYINVQGDSEKNLFDSWCISLLESADQ